MTPASRFGVPVLCRPLPALAGNRVFGLPVDAARATIGITPTSVTEPYCRPTRSAQSDSRAQNV